MTKFPTSLLGLTGSTRGLLSSKPVTLQSLMTELALPDRSIEQMAETFTSARKLLATLQGHWGSERPTAQSFKSFVLSTEGADTYLGLMSWRDSIDPKKSKDSEADALNSKADAHTQMSRALLGTFALADKAIETLEESKGVCSSKSRQRATKRGVNALALVSANVGTGVGKGQGDSEKGLSVATALQRASCVLDVAEAIVRPGERKTCLGFLGLYGRRRSELH